VTAALGEQAALLAKMRAEGVDALVGPTAALPALPLGWSERLNPYALYTFIFNLVKFPAGTVPVTYVRANEQTLNDPVKDVLSATATASMRGSEGLPVGAQVAAPPFADERVLRLMRDIERGVGFRSLLVPPLGTA
jgi:fatty acid amide hydrolase